MTPQELLKAAQDRKSVVLNGKPHPAAWVIGMQFLYIMQRINGMTIYQPKPKPKKLWKQTLNKPL